jgi:hypothetical protein
MQLAQGARFRTPSSEFIIQLPEVHVVHGSVYRPQVSIKHQHFQDPAVYDRAPLERLKREEQDL